jgi:hypothetical protein
MSINDALAELNTNPTAYYEKLNSEWHIYFWQDDFWQDVTALWDVNQWAYAYDMGSYIKPGGFLAFDYISYNGWQFIYSST